MCCITCDMCNLFREHGMTTTSTTTAPTTSSNNHNTFANQFQLFRKYKDFDLLTFVECPDHQKWSWKTTPNVAWMSKTADMISAFLRVAPNGALQSQKVKGALRVKDFSKLQDQSLSILRHWVVWQMRSSSSKHMRKASAEEKLAIDSALSLMHLETMEPDCHPKICQDLVCYLQSFMTLDGSLSSKLFSWQEHLCKWCSLYIVGIKRNMFSCAFCVSGSWGFAR